MYAHLAQLQVLTFARISVFNAEDGGYFFILRLNCLLVQNQRSSRRFFANLTYLHCIRIGFNAPLVDITPVQWTYSVINTKNNLIFIVR